MAEQSHRDEMNAAIRAQRERHAVPRSLAGTEEPQAPVEPQEALEPEPPAKQRKSLLARLLRK